MNNPTLATALHYASVLGWRVIPIPPRMKRPMIKAWQEKASNNPDVVAQLFNGHSGNIGVVCGIGSGLVVIDVDLPAGAETMKALESEFGPLPDTLTQKTGGNGKHLFFRYPVGHNIRGTIGAKGRGLGVNVDVRAEGSQVIVAPSIHESGSPYIWENALPVADLPPAWIARLESEAVAAKAVSLENSGVLSPDNVFGLHPYVAKALSNAVQKISSAEQGERNSTLFKNVCSLAGFIPAGHLSEETLKGQAEAAFLQCHPDDYDPKEFEASFASAVKAGKERPREIPDMLPPSFRIVKDGPQAGLWFTEPPKKEDGLPIEIRLGSPLYVRGLIRDDDSSNWGLLLEWNDHDEKPHRWSLPHELLSATDSSGWRSHLAKNGWLVQGGRKGHELLTRYLTSCQPVRRLIGVPRTGWHHGSFVLPDKVFSPSAQIEAIILQNPPSRNPYRQNGTREGWKSSIGLWSKDNSRLLFAICAALSGPLLGLLNQESGGFNWTGASSTGKTTTLFAAASVWGKGALSDGYILPWRSTDNGLEAQAVLHSDTILCLDELSQASARTVMEAAYMLGNSQGKARATRTGANRDPKTWRLTYLSTGEQGLTEKIAEVGHTVKAGQAVRLLDIPADAECGYGLFEELHGHASPQVFADAIKQAAATHYGYAGPEFITHLIEKADTIKAFVKDLPALAEKMSGSGADGQVRRAAMRFIICELAGAMAVKFGILPVSEVDVTTATSSCFKAWLDNRGSSGALEDKQVVERARHFIEKHGASRFQPLDTPLPQFPNMEATCHNRAGFKATDTTGRMIYYVLDDAFKEICQGIPPTRAARALNTAGVLIPGGPDRLKNKLPKDVPGLGRASAYALSVHTP